MSALAHWLEEEGIATTLVALIRLHAEKIRPPRALWVPFELGRPLGPPNDAPFQRDVLLAALQLLETASSPGQIVDFEREDPDGSADPDWQCPVSLPDAKDDLLAEVAAMTPHYQKALAKFGRTSVGLSDVTIEKAAAYLLAYADDENAQRPRSGMAPASLMRFCADDVKAYYLEAAASGEGSPSSQQMTDWFWHETFAGALIEKIRLGSAASEDKQRQTVGGLMLVPRLYQ